MKNIFVIMFLLSLGTVSAQNKQVLYGFDKIPQGLLLNPGAQTSYKYHIGVPILSGLSVSANISGITIADVFRDDSVGIFAGTNFNTKFQNALKKLGNDDYGYLNTQIEIITGGYKINHRDYLSAGFYTEIDAFFTLPKDIFTLINKGNAPFLNRVFSISQVNVKAEVLGVLHVGVSRKINNRFTAGGRFKIYSGALNVTSTNNEGNFTTREGTENIYENVLTNLDAKVHTSGIFNENNKQDIAANDIIGGTFLGGNLGLGLDVGLTYYLNQQTEITASLLDVGFINYSSKNRNGKIAGNYTFSGVEFQFKKNVDYWQNLIDDFKEKVPDSEDKASYLVMRPMKFNSSLTYRFGKTRNKSNCHDITFKDFYDNAVGGQLYADFRPTGPRFAVTGFYEHKFSNHLNTKITYTVDDFSASNFGLGISTNIWKLNIYGMVDNILKISDIADAHRASFQFGINYIAN